MDKSFQRLDEPTVGGFDVQHRSLGTQKQFVIADFFNIDTMRSALPNKVMFDASGASSAEKEELPRAHHCLLYTSPSPRD